MNSKSDYVNALQAKLDEWNARIDELEAKARQRAQPGKQLFMGDEFGQPQEWNHDAFISWQ